MRLSDLLDLALMRKLAEANYRASGMPIGIIDAADGAVLVGSGWQDICVQFHRANATTLQRCRESDEFIHAHLGESSPCEYTCKNGLRDIGIPIRVRGEHLATLFLGQFLYEGEAPDRAFFLEQARCVGFDPQAYLAALDRVPVFTRAQVENILSYDVALAEFISGLAEAALQRRDAEARAETLARFPLENPDPVFRLDGELRVSYANAAALSGLASLGLALGAPAPEPVLALARQAQAEGARVRSELTAGGRSYAMTVGASRDDVNVYAHDITTRVEAEGALHGAMQQLERIEAELRAANRAKDEFLGMLSHELRNPLAPIRNALYILDRAEPGGEQARRAREVAARQLTHLSRLVDDLLDVTRIVRGKVELRRSGLDLATLVRRTGEDHRALMQERAIHFDVEAPDEPVWIDGDETRLVQVIGNLLQNAAKFTPEGGRVTLSLRASAGAAELAVSDTGLGIEPELLPRLFQPFVQTKQTLARTEGGLGLGLALVKGLVELHAGTVSVSSEGRGRGSCFTVRLPGAPEARLRGDEHAPAAAPATGRVRVLVVDDNHDAAESLADVVRMLGHDADVAFDGWAAVENVRSRPPDLLLCDIGLPGLSGYQVARLLRSDHRFDAVRLVAVSGYAQPEDRQRALEAGFIEHVTKPADPAIVGRLLGANGGSAS